MTTNILGEIEATPERTDNTGPEETQDDVSQEPVYLLGEEETWEGDQPHQPLQLTPASTRTALLSKAASQIGTKENPFGSNKVKYSSWYGVIGAWCDMFVSWCGDQIDASDVVGKFAWTPSHYQWFKDAGRAGLNPKAGAIVFFRFYGSMIHHVGIVESVNSDGSINTIEGNTDVYGGRTGGQVMRKKRSIGIVGYGYPKYAPELAVDGEPGPLTYKELEKWLGTPVNGTFDVATKKALQKKVGVVVDGELGPKSWTAIQKYFGAPQDGVEGPVTWKAIQHWLNGH